MRRFVSTGDEVTETNGTIATAPSVPYSTAVANYYALALALPGDACSDLYEPPNYRQGYFDYLEKLNWLWSFGRRAEMRRGNRIAQERRRVISRLPVRPSRFDIQHHR